MLGPQIYLLPQCLQGPSPARTAAFPIQLLSLPLLLLGLRNTGASSSAPDGWEAAWAAADPVHRLLFATF